VWSDHRLKNQPAAEVWRQAREARLGDQRDARPDERREAASA
jgi:hypothetical protein